MKIKAQVLLISIFCMLCLQAHSASFSLTDIQFKHSGATAFIGEITAVNVESADMYFETGSVNVKVLSVIRGTISTPKVSLTYTRALQATDDASNWDNLAPMYVSLGKIGRGRQILVYLTQDSSGTYYLASAGNSVQDATTGFLLGTIKGDDHPRANNNRGCRQVEVEITELIYGWAGGAQAVSLCIDQRWFEQETSSTSSDARQQLPPAHSGVLPSNAVQTVCVPEVEGRQFFIAFDGDKITSIQLATCKLLNQLWQINSQ